MKRVYNKIILIITHMLLKIEIFKTWSAEWIAILRKRALYKDVKWTKEQQKQFDDFWKKNYGKRISNRWHKLYQASNGVFHIDYLPEIIFSTKIEPALNDTAYCKVFSDKNLNELFFDKKIDGVRTPKCFLCNSYGRFYDGNKHIISKEKAIEILSNVGAAVIKPTVDSSSGENVIIVDMKNGFNVRDGKSALHIIDSYNMNFIVQEKIIPNEELSTLYPKSINTLRVISYCVGDRVEVAPISLRIGGSGSEIDNIHSGGLSVAVSNDGKLAKKAYRLGYGNSFESFEKHPDTNVIFGDYELSFVERMISVSKELHMLTANIGVISWDLTVDDNDNIVIIEANFKGQSIWFPQMLSGKTFFGEDLVDILKEIRK